MKRMMLCTAFSAMMAVPAVANETPAGNFVTAEALLPAVKEYILQNPEVLQSLVDEYEQRQAAEKQAADMARITELSDQVFVAEGMPVLGNPEGSFTLVRFTDYRCGHCARMAPEIDKFIAAHDDVRVIQRELPILSESSVLAARFALAVNEMKGSEAYKKVHDALYQLESITPDALRSMAMLFDIDADELDEIMTSEDITQQLQANLDLANALEVTGTPTMVFGDIMVRGAASFQTMDQAYNVMIAEKPGPEGQGGDTDMSADKPGEDGAGAEAVTPLANEAEEPEAVE